MKYKILVLDIDGTLTNSKKEITKRTKDTIHRIMDSGVQVVIASGRPVQGIVPIAEELGLFSRGGYILSYNGGRIIDCKTNEIIYEKTLPMDSIRVICELKDKYKVNLISYDGDTVITEHMDDEYVQLEARINKMEIKEVPSMAEYINYPVVKCIMLEKGEVLEKIEPYVKERLSDLSVYRSEPFFLEIMPENIDKAASLERLIDRLGIKREEMVACGDGYNDLTMIKYAGLGIAMSNAADIVKENADYITLSNDEDGVAEALDKFFV